LHFATIQLMNNNNNNTHRHACFRRQHQVQWLLAALLMAKLLYGARMRDPRHIFCSIHETTNNQNSTTSTTSFSKRRGQFSAAYNEEQYLLAARQLPIQVASANVTANQRMQRTIANLLSQSLLRKNASSSRAPHPVATNRSFYFPSPSERCALNFFGLPRSFFSMALPSIIENVLLPNAVYDCDVFVYYHSLTYEPSGRSGWGGQLNPHEILLLSEAVRQVGIHAHGPAYVPITRFGCFNDTDLWAQHGELLNKTRTAVDWEGRPLYLPARDRSFTLTQTDNIIRMWHQQDSVWKLMEQTAQELRVNYTRVAMLRDDVLFVTPIDILLNGKGKVDYANNVAVIPAFAKWPINDRTYQCHGCIVFS
jgi:hypothetical protein